MPGAGLEVTLILLLILVNGIFALSEAAVVSARRARLQRRAEDGDAGARRALELVEHPNRFLATAQIGITLAGIFAGALGGATVARSLAAALRRVPALAPYSEELGLAIVVLVIAYLALVIGELVPKRIGLNNPEGIAARVAGPMLVVSRVAKPMVRLLSVSTEAILRVVGLRQTNDPPVTEEEIAHLLEAGTQAGVFEEEEQEMVERVFWLSDQQADALMTPRHRVVWLDLDDPPEVNRQKMMQHRFSRYLVCEGDLDHVLGMIKVQDLWAETAAGKPFSLTTVLRQPLFVPERTRALRVLELFRETGTHLAVVVDEYGGIEGLLTLQDVLEEIVGDMSPGTDAPASVTPREDGSLLIDASLSMDDFREAVGLPERRADDRDEFRTLGGFVFSRLGRLPVTGDRFEADGFRFEVVDMDGHRVDKVLVQPASASVLEDM